MHVWSSQSESGVCMGADVHMFCCEDPKLRAECISWLFWQVGAAPSLGGGGFKSFFSADVKIESAIDKYALEVKRQFDVLDRHLGYDLWVLKEYGTFLCTCVRT
mmetsp:Transcript_21501/g.41723  ORF Transcript_21501/g.41723 Transcript_21501/m.41723 type:complete len:104 (-) Transcript_21501:617-928(-)